MTNKELMNEVRSITSGGKKIKADWDAGGDQTLVDIKVDDVIPSEFSEGSFSWELRSLIADALSLPNAGEYYSKGSGEVYIDERGHLVICVSSRNFYDDYEYESSDEDHNPVVIIECAHEFDHYLERAQIRLVGTINDIGEYDFEVTAVPMEGDETRVDDKMKDCFTRELRAALEKQREKFSDKKGSIEFRGRYVGKGRAEFYAAYDFITIDYTHDNEVITLMDDKYNVNNEYVEKYQRSGEA